VESDAEAAETAAIAWIREIERTHNIKEAPASECVTGSRICVCPEPGLTAKRRRHSNGPRETEEALYLKQQPTVEAVLSKGTAREMVEVRFLNRHDPPRMLDICFRL